MSQANYLLKIARNSTLEFADVEFGSLQQQQLIQYSRTEQPKGAARRFLVASITKPIVAMSALKLAALGQLSLSDRVRTFVPEFDRAAFRRMTVRHLLTHTSGLPDALPNNAELRKAHADLDKFLNEAASAEQPLTFTPGSACSYSSMGFLVLARIIETISGLRLRDFLQQEFFVPLGMTNTRLGLSAEEAAEYLPTVLPSIMPHWQPDAEDWGWNSRYWRCLGAPWGGLTSTAADLGRFAQMMLNDGKSADGSSILPSHVIGAAAQDQVLDYAADASFSGPRRPWGFGWRLQWPAHSASFGDFVSRACYGHWGATGTLMWIDPVQQRYGVFLTTTPYEDSCSVIQKLSNATLMETP